MIRAYNMETFAGYVFIHWLFWMIFANSGHTVRRRGENNIEL